MKVTQQRPNKHLFRYSIHYLIYLSDERRAGFLFLDILSTTEFDHFDSCYIFLFSPLWRSGSWRAGCFFTISFWRRRRVYFIVSTAIFPPAFPLFGFLVSHVYRSRFWTTTANRMIHIEVYLLISFSMFRFGAFPVRLLHTLHYFFPLVRYAKIPRIQGTFLIRIFEQGYNALAFFLHRRMVMRESLCV